MPSVRGCSLRDAIVYGTVESITSFHQLVDGSRFRWIDEFWKQRFHKKKSQTYALFDTPLH